jgi:hypothetical protein
MKWRQVALSTTIQLYRSGRFYCHEKQKHRSITIDFQHKSCDFSSRILIDVLHTKLKI